MSHTPQYSRPTLHLRLFVHVHAHHVLSVYAYTKLPINAVDPRARSLSTQTRRNNPADLVHPRIQLTSLIQYRRPSSHLALRTREHVPRTAAAAGYGHGHDRRLEV